MMMMMMMKTLTHQALMICSESKLDDEFDFIPGIFLTAPSKTLFDPPSGITFLTSVKLNLIQHRGAMYILGDLGLVMLVIDLLTRSLLVYISVIFLPFCVWFSVRGLF